MPVPFLVDGKPTKTDSIKKAGFHTFILHIINSFSENES